MSCPLPQHPHRTDRSPDHRGHNIQPPVTVEIDTGSASSRGRPPQLIWLVRLRRGDHSVITTIGLSRTSAEHLAQQITNLLIDTEKTP
jgi:hypothetical protein